MCIPAGLLTIEDRDLDVPDLQVRGPAGVEAAVLQLGIPDLQDADYRLVRQRHELADEHLKRYGGESTNNGK